MWVRCRRQTVLWICVMGVLLFASGVQAYPYTEHLNPTEIDAYELKSDQDYSQSFKLFFGDSSSVEVDQITAFLFREQSLGSSQTITASIQTKKTSGTILWQSTISANSVPLDTNVNKDELHTAVIFQGSPVTLDTDKKYFLRFTTSTSGKLWISYDKSSSYDSLYSKAHLYEKGSKKSGQDLIFAIPEPSTFALFAWGLVLASGLRRRQIRDPSTGSSPDLDSAL